VASGFESGLDFCQGCCREFPAGGDLPSKDVQQPGLTLGVITPQHMVSSHFVSCACAVVQKWAQTGIAPHHPQHPLSYTDPTGYFFKSLFKKIGRAIGKLFKAIGRALKKALASPIFRAVVCSHTESPVQRRGALIAEQTGWWELATHDLAPR